ncbi:MULTISPECIES: GTPase HflX [unclassified Treponema]|uniref:GTPase HflX n=2 Tax=Treponema TaxID=157 RepID=UPI0025F44ED5|nr:MULTISPECIES: GTPase HflX [unclassified Treponema]
MIEIEEEQNQKIKALLIGQPEVPLAELEGLCKTLGIETVRSVNLTRYEPSPAYGIGSGKAQELCALAKELKADAIIFDYILEPRKQRNWEKLSKLAVFDRQEVILRIFSARAQTKEAVLQVQLAKLEYSLPRLAHMYGDFARQRGGNYGSKGSGETQLELDQRQVRDKIALVKKELSQVVLDRQTQRKKRGRTPCPSCAIVGYTNAGKSTLLNALTGADVFVEDKLFATLDPTTRRLNLKEGGSILLTDTVGFISNLPHSLVNAFKSTLEEAKNADLQLIVLDSSDPNVFEQYKTVVSVLEEIKADKVKRIIVLNKTDSLEEESPQAVRLYAGFSNAVKISALNHAGFEQLTKKICDSLLGKVQNLIIPTEKHALLNDIRKNGILLTEEWLADGIHVKARIGKEFSISQEEQKTYGNSIFVAESNENSPNLKRTKNRLYSILEPFLN